ncbi:MAG: hypothetical protein ACQET7_08265 [Thermodesulfobacteriota bacterium]
MNATRDPHQGVPFPKDSTKDRAPDCNIEIETLPLTREFLPRKRLVEERGELALIKYYEGVYDKDDDHPYYSFKG